MQAHHKTSFFRVCTHPNVACEKKSRCIETPAICFFVKWSECQGKAQQVLLSNTWELRGPTAVAAIVTLVNHVHGNRSEKRDPSTKHTNTFTPIGDEMGTKQRQYWDKQCVANKYSLWRRHRH